MVWLACLAAADADQAMVAQGARRLVGWRCRTAISCDGRFINARDLATRQGTATCSWISTPREPSAESGI